MKLYQGHMTIFNEKLVKIMTYEAIYEPQLYIFLHFFSNLTLISEYFLSYNSPIYYSAGFGDIF